MSIFVRARFDIRDSQQQADFEALALALRDRAAEEPGTLTYRWFSAGDEGSYLVLEEYADDDAAMAHNERAADLLARVGQCAEMVYAEIYGDVGPRLREWVRSHPQVTAYADFPGPGQGGEG
ncbi:antibiotic biosynthesis monooxygenase family protein [Streptomyces sp. NPDC007861]|uniref:putative quinol monooxygenase n=1 Tax=Streptomyces sp. NPDC007861 TaxID=3154893 RepID=UPI00340D539D